MSDISFEQEKLNDLCQDCCQILPNFKPGESKKSWQARYSKLKRKRSASSGDQEVKSHQIELERRLRYLIPEIRLVLLKESHIEQLPIGNPVDLEKYIEPLKYYSEEFFVAFHLDVKRKLQGYHIVTHGSLSESLVHPREVFKAAVLDNTSSIIVAHNHPAGSLLPSNEDILITKVLANAGVILGINLLDHIIVSSEGIKSMRQSHEHLWDNLAYSSELGTCT